MSRFFEFLKKYPNQKQASSIKEKIRLLLEPAIIKAEREFKCEEARQLDKSIEAVGMSSLSNFDSCMDKRKFNNTLNSKNPQQQYLEAVKYENNNERSRAKRIYLTIIDRASNSPFAVKAADRLASLKDVEAVESANDASRRASENAAYQVESSNNQLRESAYQQCMNRYYACTNSCNYKSSCTSGCSICSR